MVTAEWFAPASSPSLLLLRRRWRRWLSRQSCRFLPPFGTVRLGLPAEVGVAASATSPRNFVPPASLPSWRRFLHRCCVAGWICTGVWPVCAASGGDVGLRSGVGFQWRPVLDSAVGEQGEQIQWPASSATRCGIWGWRSPGPGPGRRSPTSRRRRSRRRSVWSANAAWLLWSFSSPRLSPTRVFLATEAGGTVVVCTGASRVAFVFFFFGGPLCNSSVRVCPRTFACVWAWLVLYVCFL